MGQRAGSHADPCSGTGLGVWEFGVPEEERAAAAESREQWIRRVFPDAPAAAVRPASDAEPVREWMRRAFPLADDDDVAVRAASVAQAPELLAVAFQELGECEAAAAAGAARRYTRRRRVAEGGQGEVWLARDAQGGADVAVKDMYCASSDAAHERATEAAGIQRMLRGMATSGHVVGYHAVFAERRGAGGWAEKGVPDAARAAPWRVSIVMEWAAEGDLASMLRGTEQRGEGRLPEPRVLSLASQVAKALRYMHGHDPSHPLSPPVLHMDVKPENCLLFESGELKLTDFDAARRPRPLTTSVAAVGRRDSYEETAEYRAPEVARGLFSDRGDVFSFGVVLYSLLTPEDWPLINARRTDDFVGFLSAPEFGDHARLCRAVHEQLRQLSYRDDDGARWRYSAKLVELVTDCLRHDHSRRPRMDEVFDRLQRLYESVLLGELRRDRV